MRIRTGWGVSEGGGGSRGEDKERGLHTVTRGAPLGGWAPTRGGRSSAEALGGLQALLPGESREGVTDLRSAGARVCGESESSWGVRVRGEPEAVGSQG